jgi:hypothetical protein
MTALLTWTTSEPVPTELIAKLPAALAASERSLKPMSRKSFVVILDGLFAYVEQMGLVPLPTDDGRRIEWLRDTRNIYYDACGDMPEDLFEQAVKQTIKTHQYRNLPLPGDIRAKVAVELSERKFLDAKIKTAAFFAQRQGQQAARRQPPVREVRKPRSEAEKRAVADAVAKARSALADVTIKRVPTAAGDHRAPTAEATKAAYAAIKRTGDE